MFKILTTENQMTYFWRHFEKPGKNSSRRYVYMNQWLLINAHAQTVIDSQSFLFLHFF